MTTIDDGMSDPMTDDKIAEVYTEAVQLARSNDLLGWRSLLKRFPSWVEATLVKWREQRTRGRFKSYGEVYEAVDQAVAQVAPLFVVALAGVESASDKFKNQRALLDDLLNIYGWDYSGLATIVELPNTMAYVYQGLHGAMCMSTGQYDLALELADTMIKRRYDSDYRMLWEVHDIMGWPETLGGKCTSAWDYLSKGAERWKWLIHIFGTAHLFRESLAAYYMALNVHELAWYLARMPEAPMRLAQKAELHVPLCFMQEQEVTLNRAFSQLVRERTAVEAIWNSANVSRPLLEKHWAAWLEICQRWLGNVYPLGGFREVAHANLFKALS